MYNIIKYEITRRPNRTHHVTLISNLRKRLNVDKSELIGNVIKNGCPKILLKAG